MPKHLVGEGICNAVPVCIVAHLAFGDGVIDTDIWGGGPADVLANYSETKLDATNPLYGITDAVRLMVGANNAQRGIVCLNQLSVGDNFDYSGLLVADYGVVRHEGIGSLITVDGAVIGQHGSVDNISSGLIETAVGLNGEVRNEGTGQITFACGSRSAISNNSTGLIENAVGKIIERPANGGGGTINHCVGLLVEDHSGIAALEGANLVSEGVNSLNMFEGDIEIETATRGLILTDRTTATRYRLYINNGSLGIEAV